MPHTHCTWRTRRAHPEDWLELFVARAERPLPDVTPPPLVGATRSALGRSLARFQRGEAGEGRLAAECRRLGLAPEHADAIALFVREEGRHARVLKRAVEALGESCLNSHWSDALFVVARRARGRRALDQGAFAHKMAVLAAAEIVGAAYYQTLARRLPPSALAEALAQIARDEEDHLAFHLAHLAGAPGRRLTTLLAAVAGLAIVLVDHRAALLRLSAHGDFVRAWLARCARVAGLGQGDGADAEVDRRVPRCATRSGEARGAREVA